LHNFKFPGMLNDDEQEELFNEYRLNKSIESRNMLVLHNLRLVYYFIKGYKNNERVDTDDLFQDGVLGLMEAIDNYDPEKGGGFSTVAGWYIKKHIRRSLIEISAKSLDENIQGEDGDIGTIGEIIEDEGVDILDEISSTDFLRSFVEFARTSLTYEQRLYLKHLMGLGCDPISINDIGEMMNLTKDQIHRVRYKTRRAILHSRFGIELAEEDENQSRQYGSRKKKVLVQKGGSKTFGVVKGSSNRFPYQEKKFTVL